MKNSFFKKLSFVAVACFVFLFPMLGKAQITIATEQINTQILTKARTFSTYKTGRWSEWAFAEGGVYYRYCAGYDPNATDYPAMIDAIYEVHSRTGKVWTGVVCTWSCEDASVQGVGRKEVMLQPREAKTFKFRTKNCGGASFRAKIVRVD